MSTKPAVKPRLSKTNTFQTWKEKPNRGDNWKELLMDMFYIAFLIKLSDGFLGMYMAKFEMDQYLNKFTSKDIFHHAFIVFYFFGIFVMIVNTNDTSELSENDSRHSDCPAFRPYVFGYTVGWLMTRGSTVFVYSVVAYFFRPQGVYVFVTKVPILALSIILISFNFYWPQSSAVDRTHHHSYLSLAASLSEYIGFAVWQVAIAGSYTLKFVGQRAFIPVNINHQSGRTSTFILCVLSAAIIEIMVPILQPDATYYVAIILSFSILVLVALAYFDVIPSKNTTHALGKSRLAGTVWIMVHPILAFSIFAVGVALKRMLMSAGDDISANERCMLGIFLFISSVSIVVIRITHKVMFSFGGKLSIALRLCVAAGHIISAFNSYEREYQLRVEVLLIHFSLCVVFIAVDSYKYRGTELYQMASALRTLDGDTFSREITSFGESDPPIEATGPEKVYRENAETWNQVLEDIVARKRVAKKKSRSITGPVGTSSGIISVDSSPPSADVDVIKIPRKFYSSSGILTSSQMQKRNMPYTAVDGSKVMLRSKGSLGTTSDGEGEVIGVQRGQSAVQLRTYRTVPKAAAPGERVIVVRKGMSASGIKSLSLPDPVEDSKIDAPRYMSTTDIGNGRRRSLGPVGSAGTAGGRGGERVVEKILVRRKKTDPKVLLSSTPPLTQEPSSISPNPTRLGGILERRESGMDIMDSPPGSPRSAANKDHFSESSELPAGNNDGVISSEILGDDDDGNSVIQLVRSGKGVAKL